MSADEIVTAFHEAGHAVVAAMLGHAVRLVTILPHAGLAGSCYLEDGGLMTPSEGAVFTAAADVAVKLHTNILEEHHRDFLGDGYDEASAAARKLLDTPEARARTAALAARLLREKTVVFGQS